MCPEAPDMITVHSWSQSIYIDVNSSRELYTADHQVAPQSTSAKGATQQFILSYYAIFG